MLGCRSRRPVARHFEDLVNIVLHLEHPLLDQGGARVQTVEMQVELRLLYACFLQHAVQPHDGALQPHDVLAGHLAADLEEALRELVPGEDVVHVHVQALPEVVELVRGHGDAALHQIFDDVLPEQDALELLDVERAVAVAPEVALNEDLLQARHELLVLGGRVVLLGLQLVFPGRLHLVGHEARDHGEEREVRDQLIYHPDEEHPWVHFVDHPRRRGPIVAGAEDKQRHHGSAHGAELLRDERRVIVHLSLVAHKGGEEDGKGDQGHHEHDHDPEDAREGVAQAQHEQVQLLELPQQAKGPQYPEQPHGPHDHQQLPEVGGVLGLRVSRPHFSQQRAHDPLVYDTGQHDDKVENVPPPLVLVDEEVTAVDHDFDGELDDEPPKEHVVGPGPEPKIGLVGLEGHRHDVQHNRADGERLEGGAILDPRQARPGLLRVRVGVGPGPAHRLTHLLIRIGHDLPPLGESPGRDRVWRSGR
mmetsp:Transcript_49851/g.131766  ORF Transcript_49851/g.131766 Transcript_49851/m.131766 type:complete len:476 (+) Transcript_49851:15-1442(+)